ncbi:MAG: DUF1549 domain-containing protein [Planctomycetota bacterium]|nr:DUF1549 domain-containing protein [Planctomycetota bacterium]MDA1165545.1 DUF1549 domain-containing protein [Planctomycetota bacterium]
MKNSQEHPELTGFLDLLELQVEDRITPEQFTELEATIRADNGARQLYIQYMDLHGSLHWDLALTADSDRFPSDDLQPTSSATGEPEVDLARPARQKAIQWQTIAGTACCVILLVFVSTILNTPTDPADNSVAGPAIGERVEPLAPDEDSHVLLVETDHGARNLQPPQPPLPGSRRPGESDPRDLTPPATHVVTNAVPAEIRVPGSLSNPVASGGSTEAVVATINRLIQAGWTDNEITPSALADDSEWLRRVYLDTVGHIPSADQVRKFLANKRPDKRSITIDTLLDDEDYIRNWTTVWTNLLIGRSNPREVNRPALQKYLRESFAENRGWDDIVTDFIAAEGSHDENGATNFLLAHVNNQAVPATAITGHVFLGLQLQCTQCHNHPFNNQKQDEFWAFNSFFKQIKVQDQPISSNPPLRKVALVNTREGGATFYETRQGVMKAVFPSFQGHSIDANDGVNRRAELARLMTEGDSPQIARAYVNRMWQHFFGAAFTPQVDDMGPHVAVSHPELLDELTRQFVRSGYDAKQLVRWICRSEAYSLTSRFNSDAGNEQDDPSLGLEPLFSRSYVKQMSVEQLFDSLLIATQAHEVFGSSWDAVEAHRQKWLQQFVMAWDTDENDEVNLFDGTVPQALMMMNGNLVDLALESEQGTLLDRITRSSTTENEKIETIALAALSRMPSRQESAAVRKMIRESAPRSTRLVDQQLAMRSGLQDLMWACLNSNEFILIH